MAELQLTGEDEALVALLEKVDGLYAEQQRIAKSMRKGFLNITKARQSMGRNALSALNCRELVDAQVRVDATHEEDAGMLWERHRESPGAVAPQNGAVRRRGAGGLSGPIDEDTASSHTPDEPAADDAVQGAAQKNTLMLFGGLVPPPMRKAKADFALAVEHCIAAANIAQSIALAEREIRAKYPHMAPPQPPVMEEAEAGTAASGGSSSGLEAPPFS
mmetsp:Transcript_104506/g.301274  ORF Transcript_104506/g.301274 Transcript_104506/m.301274 type:complete len:218 (+) Transcript_104506:1187-1840(+)